MAAAFSCGASKVAYLAKCGIAPFFTDELISSVKASSQCVVLFDELLNNTTEKNQMDIHVHFWVGDSAQIQSCQCVLTKKQIVGIIE